MRYQLRIVMKNRNVHELSFFLFLAGILAYGAGLAWFMLDRFDFVDMTRWPSNLDDSFYYFQIARNLAEGKFSTFDGGITRTNGYHPLWMLLITPFYWIFDSESALLAIKAFEIMLIAGGVALVVMAARICSQPWILLIAVLPSLYSQYGMLLGMETAAALFILGLFLLVLCLYARNPVRWRWLLATMAFVLPWVRLELIAVSVAATTVLAFIEIDRAKQEKLPGEPPRSLTRHVRLTTLVPLLGALAGLLTYFIYNFVIFGGIVPVSGAAKMMWSQLYWDTANGYSLIRNLWKVLHFRAFNLELLAALEICACLFLVWRFSRRSRKQSDWSLLVFLVGVSALAVGHLAQFGQAVLTVHPRWEDTPWYFPNGYLMMTLFIPVNIYVVIHFMRRFVEPQSRALSLNLRVVVAGVFLLLVTAVVNDPYRGIAKRSHHTFQSGKHGWVSSYLATRVANRLLPDSSIIGAWDAGIIGYFSRFPVVNLDGLVNSYEYLRTAKIEYLTKHEFYMDYDNQNSAGITHYTNYGQGVPTKTSMLLYAGAPFPRKGTEMRHRVWAGDPTRTPSDGYDNGARFWEKMEPHLTYRQDHTGVLLEDRIAQIFVRDCEPKKLLIFSWISERSGIPASALYHWKDTKKNDLGFCVGVFELPNDAIRVHIETISVDAYARRLLGDLKPIIRSDFDIYLKDNTLIYVNDRCNRGDLDKMFFVRLSTPNRGGFFNRRTGFGLNFDLKDHGAWAGGQCIAEFELPKYDIAHMKYDIAHIRTGQRAPWEASLWEGSFDFARQAGDR